MIRNIGGEREKLVNDDDHIATDSTSRIGSTRMS